MMSRFEQFSYMVSGMYRYIHKIEKAEMVKHGYKGAFAIYLATLSRYPEGLNSARLCDICDKDKAAVSRIISEMQEKGLVEKVQLEDRIYRAKIVLTEKGREVAKMVNEKSAAAAEAVSGKVVGENEREEFYALLEKMCKNLQTVAEQGIPTKTKAKVKK